MKLRNIYQVVNLITVSLTVLAVTSCNKSEKNNNNSKSPLSWTPEKKRQARKDCKIKYEHDDKSYIYCIKKIPMDGDWDTLGAKKIINK